MLALYAEKCSFYHNNMIISEEVNQFLKDICESEVAGTALATSFSADEKKRIVSTVEIFGLANPTTLHQNSEF